MKTAGRVPSCGCYIRKSSLFKAIAIVIIVCVDRVGHFTVGVERVVHFTVSVERVVRETNWNINCVRLLKRRGALPQVALKKQHPYQHFNELHPCQMSLRQKVALKAGFDVADTNIANYASNQCWYLWGYRNIAGPLLWKMICEVFRRRLQQSKLSFIHYPFVFNEIILHAKKKNCRDSVESRAHACHSASHWTTCVPTPACHGARTPACHRHHQWHP